MVKRRWAAIIPLVGVVVSKTAGAPQSTQFKTMFPLFPRTTQSRVVSTGAAGIGAVWTRVGLQPPTGIELTKGLFVLPKRQDSPLPQIASDGGVTSNRVSKQEHTLQGRVSASALFGLRGGATLTHGQTVRLRYPVVRGQWGKAVFEYDLGAVYSKGKARAIATLLNLNHAPSRTIQVEGGWKIIPSLEVFARGAQVPAPATQTIEVGARVLRKLLKGDLTADQRVFLSRNENSVKLDVSWSRGFSTLTGTASLPVRRGKGAPSFSVTVKLPLPQPRR